MTTGKLFNLVTSLKHVLWAKNKNVTSKMKNNVIT